jgi:bifunctional non-homologous end joining protein LigD
MSEGFPKPPIPPMEPVKCDQAFDSENHIFQVKWDGVRMLTFYNGTSVTLQNRRLHNRNIQYPELQALSSIVKHPVVIDGEVITLKDGKPSFPTVMRRDRAGSARTVSTLVNTIPISYMVFDILYYRNQATTNLPWHKRHEILQDLLSQSAPPFHLVESFSAGTALFSEVQRMGLEGVVAKVKDSRYIPGGKSRLWQKIKNRPLITCFIGGFTRRGRNANSLLLGVFDEDQFLYVGRAGSGLKENQWASLTQVLLAEQTSSPPFVNPPKKAGLTWVKPVFQVIVEYAEWTEETRLRSPVIKCITGTDPMMQNASWGLSP